MSDEHIRNLEQMIRNYRTPIEDDGIERDSDVGINEGKVLDFILKNNRITAKEIADLLSVSLRQGKRIMTGLKEKGVIRRVGSSKSGHWETVDK